MEGPQYSNTLIMLLTKSMPAMQMLNRIDEIADNEEGLGSEKELNQVLTEYFGNVEGSENSYENKNNYES